MAYFLCTAIGFCLIHAGDKYDFEGFYYLGFTIILIGFAALWSV